MEENRILVRFVDQETGEVFTEGFMTKDQIRLLHWMKRKNIMYDGITFSVQENTPEII